MSYFEDYDYSEPSELDQLVDDTTDKIKEMIVTETKEKVDTILNKAKVTEQRLEIAYNRLREADEEISSLTKENKKLKEELEQKRTSLNTLPFEIGQKVYYCKPYVTEDVVCPLCNGKGTVTTHSDEYGDVEIRCPKCKDTYYWNDKVKQTIKQSSYRKFGVCDALVEGLFIDIKKDKSGEIKQEVNILLKTDDIYNKYGLEDIYTESQLKECKEACDRRNKQSKEEAERKVGILE